MILAAGFLITKTQQHKRWATNCHIEKKPKTEETQWEKSDEKVEKANILAGHGFLLLTNNILSLVIQNPGLGTTGLLHKHSHTFIVCWEMHLSEDCLQPE